MYLLLQTINTKIVSQLYCSYYGFTAIIYNFINALYPFLWRGEGMAFFWKGGIAKRRGMKQTMIFMNEST